MKLPFADDDFDLADRDFDEFIRRGRAEREWEAENEHRRQIDSYHID
ncbi:hypothetical protein [Cohnella nanjingensis]|uniref:Uncharacterized protein n=1 Tax=Cohnella nanjingensis TaxID=1387779 RepID=A0A7X0VG07_9BACL|nr:hypothetical protein [Cohnella nanjingensis]MBB6672607.1 hypothetical protein [Cohnella nanjingensis]